MRKYIVILARALTILLVLVVAVACASAPKSETETPIVTPPPAETPKAEPTPEVPQQQPEISQQQPQSGSIILDGAKTYTVVWKDTLSKISKRYYGAENGYFYGLIMLASNITDPDIIIPGTQLVIPDLQRNLADSGARARLKSYSLEIADIHAAKNHFGTASNMRKLANTL